MAAWILVPCLISLRSEFNQLSPSRDKGADGSIGDSAHTSSSDHTPDEDSDVLRDHDADDKNEVHALDIDSTGPWPEPFDTIMKRLVAREKAEYNSADVFGRLKYVIWNRRIAERSNGWAWRDYTLSDPHTNHAHFSARYTTAQENDTRPWGLLEGVDMPLETADVSKILAAKVKVGDEDWPLGTAIGYSARKSYEAVRDLGAFVSGEVARDAQTAAALAGMNKALTALASANGALTAAQVATLTEQVRSAAAQAGAEATTAISAKVDALREHLGDDARPAA